MLYLKVQNLCSENRKTEIAGETVATRKMTHALPTDTFGYYNIDDFLVFPEGPPLI